MTPITSLIDCAWAGAATGSLEDHVLVGGSVTSPVAPSAVSVSRTTRAPIERPPGPVTVYPASLQRREGVAIALPGLKDALAVQVEAQMRAVAVRDQ